MKISFKGEIGRVIYAERRVPQESEIPRANSGLREVDLKKQGRVRDIRGRGKPESKRVGSGRKGNPK